MKKYLFSVFGVDLRSLAVLRIGCASLILLDLIQRATDLTVFYTDYGVAPRSLVIENSNRWAVSLHYMSGVWQWQAALFLLGALAALALLVGYQTQLASIVTWVLCVSLINRNPFVGYSADVLLRNLLFWGMFLPWASMYSVDSAWQDDPATESEYVSLGTAGYVIQVVCVYLFSALLKSGAEWWRQGSAIYYALNIDYLATPLGKALQQLPLSLVKPITWAVLVLEICAPLLLLYPGKPKWIRWAAAMSIVALHLAISSVLFVGIFPLIGITAMVFFLPPEFWNFMDRKIGATSATSVKIYYDEDCGFCLRTVRLIKTFLVLPNVDSTGAQTVPEIENEMRERNSWVVLDTRGDRHFGYDGILVVAGASPIFRYFLPMLRLALFQWCGERLYGYVASHRRLSCELPHRQIASCDRSPRMRVIVNVALIFLIAYVVILNLATVKALHLRIPDRAEVLSVGTGLDQSWNMFAPFPAKDDGWYVIPGKLRNGTVVDLFRAGRPVSFAKPSYGSFEFKNHRWVKFSENLRNHPFLQPVYARYLCHNWNQRHRGGESLEELEIIYVLELTQPPPEYSPIEKQSKYKFKCDR